MPSSTRVSVATTTFALASASGVALGGVTDRSYRFEAFHSLDRLTDTFNGTSLGNESFVEEGDDALLPFGRSTVSGGPLDSGGFQGRSSITSDLQTVAPGGVAFSGLASASFAGVFLGDGFTSVRSRVDFFFTLNEIAVVSITGSAGGSGGNWSWFTALTTTDGAEVFDFGDEAPIPNINTVDDAFPLSPGDYVYTLFAAADDNEFGGSAFVDATLDVGLIPGVGSPLALLVGVGLAARRRR
ncbi:MAG: hypothetical protein AAGK04_00325 [Planctomycetota bacterium]